MPAPRPRAARQGGPPRPRRPLPGRRRRHPGDDPVERVPHAPAGPRPRHRRDPDRGPGPARPRAGGGPARRYRLADARVLETAPRPTCRRRPPGRARWTRRCATARWWRSPGATACRRWCGPSTWSAATSRSCSWSAASRPSTRPSPARSWSELSERIGARHRYLHAGPVRLGRGPHPAAAEPAIAGALDAAKRRHGHRRHRRARHRLLGALLDALALPGRAGRVRRRRRRRRRLRPLLRPPGQEVRSAWSTSVLAVTLDDLRPSPPWPGSRPGRRRRGILGAVRRDHRRPHL